jgi:cobalamin biosynthesis protein CbiG
LARGLAVSTGVEVALTTGVVAAGVLDVLTILYYITYNVNRF